MPDTMLTPEPVLGDEGEARTNGPVIIYCGSPETAEAWEALSTSKFLWNRLAYDLDRPERYHNFASALTTMVREMKKITAIKAMRGFARALGYEMTLWEAKHTLDAVRGSVIQEERRFLTDAVARGNIGMIERSMERLRRLGAL